MRNDSLADLVATNTATSPHRVIYGQTSGWDTETWFPQRPAWQAQGACHGVDPNVFHPEPIGDRRRRTYASMDALYAEALICCRSCPVVDECREYALRTGQREGMWGALRPGQRDTIWKKQRAGRVA